MLLHDFRERRPDVAVLLLEDKTIRLLPRPLSGRLELAAANVYLFACSQSIVDRTPTAMI